MTPTPMPADDMLKLAERERMNMSSKRVEDSIDAAKLLKMIDAATRGPWRIDRGLMNDALNITAYDREGSDHFRKKENDGPICRVSTERLHFDHDKDRFGNFKGESRSWRTPIKKAQADAELIVAAVNALPKLLRRLKLDVDETAWLVEFPADKYGPIRYWSAADPQPVISADDATRFCRQKDAEAVAHAKGLTNAKAVEHMWMAPQKATKRALTKGSPHG